MMRKTILGLVAIAAIATPLAFASSASAAVSVNDAGVGHVDKSDVQLALGWNNKAFDNGAGTLNFTAGAEKITVDYPMSCFNLNTGAVTSGGHRLFVQSGMAAVEATPVLNLGNGRQITGFDLSGKSTGFTPAGSTVVRDVTCGADTVLFMNEGSPTQPGTMSVTGGLKVNGFDLPNTPVVVPAPVL